MVDARDLSFQTCAYRLADMHSALRVVLQGNTEHKGGWGEGAGSSGGNFLLRERWMFLARSYAKSFTLLKLGGIGSLLLGGHHHGKCVQ